MAHQIRITGLAPGYDDARITIDGAEVPRDIISGLALTAEPGDAPRLTLDVLALDLAEIEGTADVHLPDATQELLVRLGWTPPEARDALRDLHHAIPSGLPCIPDHGAPVWCPGCAEVCSTCHDENGDRVPWPCADARALMAPPTTETPPGEEPLPDWIEVSGSGFRCARCLTVELGYDGPTQTREGARQHAATHRATEEPTR
ncbi:hypothetical protein [Allonocardiopsis opalescens]|uniref:Uncharacterized protein n=1 Tax=Allonocardiopsis opalescens TaxID=1144618 RepID=A0A2T0PVN6_9ACTN|nr:hypothetical protein [Allonocardiopsis opalescens]PRX95592.1 hypothetical protein CLV72_109201 [Allonocardiopsis opalescens]